MKKKILTVFFVFFGLLITLLNPPVCGIIALGGWIYVVVGIKKQKNIFNESSNEPEKVSKIIKKYNILLWMSGILILMFFICEVFHGIYGDVYFLIAALTALCMFLLFTGFIVFHFLKEFKGKKSENAEQ